MIIGKIHPGSGLGDQLFSYIATRVIALDKGYDFGFVGKEFFKGRKFMNLDWGKESNFNYHIDHISKALHIIKHTNDEPIPHFRIDTPYYNPEVNFVEDGTVIDGYGAQDIRYFEHRLDEVREWLKVHPVMIEDGVCLINFRGGEYQSVPDLFLPQEYWDKAIEMMRNKYPKIKFVVETDDKELAQKFFPDFFVSSNIESNWRHLRQASHLIISNSAFAILPALLNENVKEVIAPRYWAGRNVGEWRRPNNYYKKLTYI